MSKEKQIENMIEIVKPFVSGLACGDESGSCELTDCRSCNARSLANKLLEADCGKQSGWISVEERLPEVRQRVLLYSHHDGVNTGYRADEIGRFYVDKSYPYRPTHWMPLPDAPKGGAE